MNTKIKHDPRPRDDAEVIKSLLDLVTEVARELHPGHGISPATLDSSLDRDLAVDSLGRMELMHRAEVAFGVALPETALAATETPRDLLRAIHVAQQREATYTTSELAETSPPYAEGVAVAAPLSVETLVEALAWHAKHNPNHPHIRLYADDGDGDVITYAALWASARNVAQNLRDLGLGPGRSVAIMLATGRDYFACFAGVLIAGGVPVPVYPPGRPSEIEDHLKRHAAILDNALAQFLIVEPDAKKFARLLIAAVDGLDAALTPSDLGGASRGDILFPRINPEDTAFLQYTSGSTGMPKGVVLSHANLLANIRAMGTALEVNAHDVFVSWLPLYHDMGLIGAWLGTMYYAVPLVLMSPLAFLSRPARWLRAIHRYRGTISGAPNFAYELCLSRVSDAEMEGLDLSSWRVAFNGAEPVHPQTLERFGQRFGACRFRREAMMPVYGLAENSVGLAFPPLGRGPKIDYVSRKRLAEAGIAEPAAADAEDAIAIPSCGIALPGHQFRVVDEGGRELPDRREGRIEFAGPSATSGYYRNAEQTAALFDGAWLDAQDLGYTVDGEIYVTGRSKDVIIRAGRNIFPAEFETAIGEVDGIQRGNVAVFGAGDPQSGTERVVVMAETRRQSQEAQDAQREEINALAWSLIGGPPDEIVFVPPRTVPKTSSGKIRRQAAREMYLAGRTSGKPRAVPWQIARLAMAGIGPELRRRARAVWALIFAAYGWVLLVTAAPFWWLATLVLPTRRSRWAAVRGCLRLISLMIGAPVHVTGRENLPPEGTTFIVVANHASYLDGPTVVLALNRPVRFVAKSELLGSKVVRHFLSRLGTFFVERFDVTRSIADAERVAAAAREPDPLVYFPEATFTRVSGLLPFQMGAFVAAAEAGVPVVPLAIRGTRAMLRDESGFLRPGNVSVVIGKPILPVTGENIERNAGSAHWRSAIALRRSVRQFILSHCGEPDLARERSPLIDGTG